MYKIGETEKEYGKKIKSFELKKISMIQDGSVNVTVYFTFSNEEKYENCYTIHWEKYYNIVCRN